MTPEELEAIRTRRWDMRPTVTPLNDRGVQAVLDREALLEEVDRLRAENANLQEHLDKRTEMVEHLLIKQEERVAAQIHKTTPRTKRSAP